MKMKQSLSAMTVALLSLAAAGVARAESTYGYNTTGGGTVTATARVNISIVVPKVVLLRVGTPGATRDTLTWNARVASGSTAVNGDLVAPVGADSQPITWAGSDPVAVSLVSSTAAAGASAWTNGSSVAVTCTSLPITASVAGATGPALTDLTVAATGAGDNFAPPSADAACTAGSTALTRGTTHNATWTYTLDATNASSWDAATYSTTITYTASGV